MSFLGRTSLVLGLILLFVAIILATMNFITIRDYLVALAAQRSRDFYNVNPRLWITYLVVFGAACFWAWAWSGAGWPAAAIRQLSKP